MNNSNQSESHPNAIVELSQLSRVFRTDELETHALRCADLIIHPGEYVSISGPSGSGKSTLLSLVGLLDRSTDGVYRLEGRDVTDLTRRERARVRNESIGFIFQAFNLIDDLTVEENVELVLRYRGVRRGERKQRVAEALESVGMSHRLRHLPAQLSGGQQQRVAVARAIVGRPSLLLADEPTGNLDSRNAEAVMDLLDGLHDAGSTICMVTHDARYASRAPRTVKLSDGRIVADGETFAVLNADPFDQV